MFDQIPRMPLREWVNDGMRWVRAEYRDFFNSISDVVEWFVEDIVLNVLSGPVPIVLGVFIALSLLAGGWRLALFTAAGMGLILNLQIWPAAMSTIALVLAASIFCIAVGLPLGVAAARYPRVEKVVRPTLDFMQTMPAFVYLIPAIAFFRVGVVSAAFATVVFALPPMVRLVVHGIQNVDPEVKEASEAFGSNAWQTLVKVQLPLARQDIMVGVNQMLMLALSMVVIASMVGAQGLGGIVYSGVSQLDSGLAFEGGISVVIVAVILDRITQGLGADRSVGGRGPLFGGFGDSVARTMRQWSLTRPKPDAAPEKPESDPAITARAE